MYHVRPWATRSGCCEESAIAAGFAAAFLGFVEHAGAHGTLVGFDPQKAIEILVDSRGGDSGAAEAMLLTQLAANWNKLDRLLSSACPTCLSSNPALSMKTAASTVRSLLMVVHSVTSW